MSAIFKAIHEFDKRIEVRAEHFAFKHPYLSFFAVFIGMPEMDASRIEVYQTVSENEK